MHLIKNEFYLQQLKQVSCKTDADLKKFLAEKSRDAVSYIVKKCPNYYEVIKSNCKDSHYEFYYKFINNKDK